MSYNAHDLSKRLLNALDNDYNVIDMHGVNEIISILEKINITKELLETTRLGKHVNELRRKTSDPTLARRAKVLVKRWRDLVIPSAATVSPAHTGAVGSNRCSAERSMRRLGGTPLTSPALTRQVLSPAVSSPRPPSRPAWGGYESDSQDVILVDDDPPPPAPPPPPPAALLPSTPTKRPTSPAAPLSDEKKAKRDKKPKKRRGHSRAGSGSETTEGWSSRNGTPAPVTPQTTRKNGCRPPVDAYSVLVNRMPPAGAKKVKTTQELLEHIQSRAKPVHADSADLDDVLICDNSPISIKVDSPLRNGSSRPHTPAPSPPSPKPPLPPIEDEREYADCTCGETAEEDCPAAFRSELTPYHVTALHHAYLPGINGTRRPPAPRQHCVRVHEPPLFASVVPLYKYSDYADDYCVKNMSRVPLALSSPSPSQCKQPSHRTTEKTKDEDGEAIFRLCEETRASIPYVYNQTDRAPVVTLPLDKDKVSDVLDDALQTAVSNSEYDALGRPPESKEFTEWHETADLGGLLALPYVVID